MKVIKLTLGLITLIIITPRWRNPHNFSWEAPATRNSAPYFHGLQNQANPQFNNQEFYPPSSFHPPYQEWHSSTYSASCDDKMLAVLEKLEADTKLVHKLAFQVGQLINALNQIEEEEFWSQVVLIMK